MSTANKEAQASGDPPVRQGALSAEQIRAECPQFRILIIGKANAGKTTILRKVCNAKPDAKPIVYDAKGKEVRQEVPGQQVPTKVRLGSPPVLTKLTKNLGHHDSLDCSRCLRFFNETRDVLQMSSTLLLRLSNQNIFIIVSNNLLAWRT
jgi:ABC-type cobalamin/Fe3+-siderophores transport system ATPase subunit